MKVISGSLKGRNINGYNIDGTRPTMDRVKESIFGSIQNYVKDSVVLDLFSGSGNYGIEAISNYAKMCYFNDINKECIKVIRKNLDNFNINNGIILNFDYKKCLKYLYDNNIKLDIIFLDPPYKLIVIDEILELIKKYDLLNKRGIIVCEYQDSIISNNYFKLIKEKKYGIKRVNIYENE